MEHSSFYSSISGRDTVAAIKHLNDKNETSSICAYFFNDSLNTDIIGLFTHPAFFLCLLLKISATVLPHDKFKMPLCHYYVIGIHNPCPQVTSDFQSSFCYV